MFDVVLGLLLAAAVVRGWMTGFVRSVVGLVVVLLGTVLALRLSGPAGSMVAGIAGTSPGTSRVIGGLVVFLACSVAGLVVLRMTTHVLDALPGLPTLDRAAGALVAGLAAVLVITLVVSAVRVLPIGGIADGVEQSELAGVLTDPDRLPQQTLAMVGGDRVLSVALRLDDVFGTTTLGDPGTETVAIAAAARSDLEASDAQAAALYAAVNHARSAADVAPLARSAELDAVALGHATAMYEGGWMAHAAPDGTRLPARLAAAGVPATATSELIGLGPSVASVVDVWETEDHSAARLAGDSVSRVGVAAVTGPTGVLAVVVMTG